ncbi:EF hand domain-containing protein [Cardiosporidium cionae]|uniref:EF hand domain-containing protein n=1 Tax=Cardiosporidium cionae TaxID=476202 RepID=A0ABQ7JEQ9_9APIC|nr:EF hand domain-containing protein [Cardiosporidium cionae]|eukprot:KAF8822497.1 EF hand domain-containing protein [Cardiosporidium cionae]
MISRIRSLRFTTGRQNQNDYAPLTDQGWIPDQLGEIGKNPEIELSDHDNSHDREIKANITARTFQNDRAPHNSRGNQENNFEERKGQQGTDFMKNVPIVRGIPIFLIRKSYNWSVISTIIPLPMNLNSTLNLRNCATRFVQTKDDSYVHLRGWIHLMEPNIEGVVSAAHSDRDGQVSFLLNGNSSYYSSDPIHISSGAAPIKIKSKHPLLIQMNDESLKNCLFRATGGAQINSASRKSTALLYPSGINHMFAKLKSIPILFESQESPLYATSLSQSEEISKASLETWAGNAQFMAPHLTNLSEGRIRDAMDWITTDTSGPWVLVVQTLGDAFTGGLWRLLSSNAYLRSVRWFIVGTGGMLQPRVFQLQIHILGLFCREHPDAHQNVIKQHRKPFWLSAEYLQTGNRALEMKNDINSALSNSFDEVESRPNVVTAQEIDPKMDKQEMDSQVIRGELLRDETLRHHSRIFNSLEKENLQRKNKSLPNTHQSNEIEARQLQEESKKEFGQNLGKTAHDFFCENEMLEDTFLVLWHALQKIQSRSTLFVWTSDEEKELKFSLKNYVIEKKRIGITESWLFTVAIGINLCFSLIAAVTAIVAIHRFLLPLLLKDEKEKRILRTASHRLDQEHSVVEQEEWNLIVSTVFWPGHGFLLRWSQVEKEANFVRFYVHFQPAQLPWNQASETGNLKELMDKEVFIYFPYSTVESSHELGLNQKHCFVPIRHPGIIELETSETYSLELLTPYRIRVGGINSQGKIMQRSSWSPVVIGDIPLSFLDISSMVLSRLFLSNTSSLDIFLKKFVDQVSHFDISIRLRDLKLQTFGISADIETKIVHQRFRTTKFKQTSMPRSSLKYLQEDDERNETAGNEETNEPLELKDISDLSSQHTLPFLKSNYTVRAFFGYKSQQAKELMYKTGRRVFSQVRFEGNPKFCTTITDGLNQAEAYLEFSANKHSFILRKDRISYNVIGFEVASGTTGQIIAFVTLLLNYPILGKNSILLGYIRFEDLYRVLRERYKTEDAFIEAREYSKANSGGILDRLKRICGINSRKSINFQDIGMESRFRIALECVDGGGPWGRVECSLDAEDMTYFVRHAEPKEDLETAIQRRHHRKRTGFQSMPELSNLRKEAEERSSRLDFKNEETGPQGPVANDNEKMKAESAAPQIWKTAVSASIAAKRFLNANVAIQPANDRISEKTSHAGAQGKDFQAYFSGDSPSHPILQGGDLFVQWAWSNSSTNIPEEVYLHLFDHETNKWISSLHWGRPIPNTGSYAWHVDTSFKPDEHCQVVYLALYIDKVDLRLCKNLDYQESICQSNAFIIIKPLALSELEFAYAAFCRSFGLEMEHVSEGKLSQLGYSVQESSVKICPDLRTTLCVEPMAEAIHCPGQCVVSTQSKLVLLRSEARDLATPSLEIRQSDTERRVVVYKQTRRTKRPMAWKIVNGIGVFLIIIATLFYFTFAFSFILWFLLGALVNSDSFLPYAVMVGSLLFVVGMLWINFQNSREAVIKFIDENMPLLLSLALDHWFESVNINYANNMEVFADEKLLSYRNRIRDELRECKLRMRRDLHYEPLDEMDSLTESKSGMSPRLLSQFSSKENDIFKLKRKRERFITFAYEKISSKNSEGFYFSDSGEAKGLEKETWLPTGVRFATVAEAEKFSGKIEDMLVGWEVAMLTDGVKHGPRYGYKLERRVQPGQCYRYAIVALPRYPPADELEESAKIQLIFDYYNKDGDEFWNEEEFRLMYSELKGYSFEEQKWSDLCDYYNDIVNTNIVPLEGVTLKDLSKIYSLQTGELDRDYEKLFPVVRAEEIDDFDYEEFDQMSEAEDMEGEIESISDYEEASSEEDIEEERWREEEVEAMGKSQRTEKEIKTNINAGKIHFIYNYGTQEHRGQHTDELLTSVPFLASKILETTIKLLSPVFGKEVLIGAHLVPTKTIRSNSGTFQGGVNYEEALNAAHQTEEHHLTDMMKLIHFELFQELSKQFRLAHAAMFDTNNVRNGIADFYDNIMPQKISLKGSRILNSQIELTLGEVHSANSTSLQSSPPKTASQFVRAVQTYRIEADDAIKELFFIATKSQATLQAQLQLHLFTEMVHTLGILEDSEIVTEIVDVPIERGQVKELPNTLQKITYAFKFLVQILGIDLDTDELPGGAVKIHHNDSSKDYEGNKLITKSSLDKLFSDDFKQSAFSSSFEDMEAKQACRDRNLIRLHSVFDQLSNSSGFLAVDLADEAILLLTDNRLNFSGVVACLQHLKIGSIHIKEGDDYSKALEELGIHKGSPVCDITAANDTVSDTFDWTFFCKDPVWTPNLMRAFNRLSAACPGFMGKSQMYEFVREIHKLFQPQVSQMRKGRDRFRGKKKGTKGGIMQLGALNDQYLRFATTGIFNEPLSNIEMNLDIQEEGMRMTSFEMFHKVMLKIGLSVGHRHSRIMWIIICCEGYDEIQQFLSENDVKMGVLRFYLQPLVQFGKKAGPRDSIGDITSYRGYITYAIFRRFLRKLGVIVPEKGARSLWDDLTKDPLNITDFLPEIAQDWQVPTKYLRIEMDKTGMDPTKGRLTSIDTLTRQLPRMLMTGLWPDGIRMLIRLELQWKVSDDRLNFVLSTLERKSNRYGLLKPEEIGVLLSNLSVKGMSFAMLREVIQKMRINMPDKDVKRMFDLMDLNHDLTLSLTELLGGFGSLKSGVSTVVQTLIAILGAVGLQSGASQEIDEVKERMRLQIEEIMGDPLSKAKQQVEELQEAIKPESHTKREEKPQKLRYLVPKRCRPELEDPRPCVTFQPGTYILMEPTISNQIDKSMLRWTIIPRLPQKSGLTFSEKTGIIEGFIPLKDSSEYIRAKAEKMDTRYMEDLCSDTDRASMGNFSAAAGRHATGKELRIGRKTYVVIVRNSAGSTKTRITFRIQPRSVAMRQSKKDSTTLQPTGKTENTKLRFRKMIRQNGED